MPKNKDYISEEEFNRKSRAVPSSPRRDSPGDSETDSLYEIEMGFDEEATDTEDDFAEDEDIPAFDKSAADDRTKFVHKDVKSEDDVPSSGKAVSSDKPSPREDRDKRSNTH